MADSGVYLLQRFQSASAILGEQLFQNQQKEIIRRSSFRLIRDRVHLDTNIRIFWCHWEGEESPFRRGEHREREKSPLPSSRIATRWELAVVHRRRDKSIETRSTERRKKSPFSSQEQSNREEKKREKETISIPPFLWPIPLWHVALRNVPSNA